MFKLVGFYINAYISPIWGAGPSQPILTIFDVFSDLADVIHCANFSERSVKGFLLDGAWKWLVPIGKRSRP
jgi:hypothetical protein